MAIRIVNEQDVINYSGVCPTYGGMTGITVGDIMIDDGTQAPEADGKEIVYIRNAPAYFTGLTGTVRTGATIWVDGRTKTYYQFIIDNGNGGNTEWEISDINNYVHVRPIGQVKVFRNSGSTVSYAMWVSHIKYIKIVGESPDYPGLRWGLPSGSTPFLRGKFGFWLSDDDYPINDGFMLSVGAAIAEDVHIIGVETEHGFAAMRLYGYNRTVSAGLKVERCYLHDGATGEGFYMGMTSGTIKPVFRKTRIVDTIVTRRAAEMAQLQELGKFKTKNPVMENVVLKAGGTAWKAPFELYQDKGIQYIPIEGGCFIKNLIIDGWASEAINYFSSTGGTISSDPAVLKNVLFNDGRSTGPWFSSSLIHGVQHKFEDLYFREFNDTYTEVYTGGSVNYVIADKNSNTDEMIFKNINWDDSKTNLFENETDFKIINPAQDNSMPAPEYILDGFPNRTSEQIEQWTATILPGLGQPTSGQQNSYSLNDIVINLEAGIEYAFYNCISGHTVTGSTTPRLDTTNWEKIEWDVNGYPSYYSGFTTGYTSYPPDNLGLVSNLKWNKLGMGTYNAENDDYSIIRWWIADDDVGTNKKQIPNANTVSIDRTRYSQFEIGKYYAMSVVAKDSENYTYTERFSPWTEITFVKIFTPHDINWQFTFESEDIPTFWNTNTGATIPSYGIDDSEWSSSTNRPYFNITGGTLDFDNNNEGLTISSDDFEHPYEYWVKFKMIDTTGYGTIFQLTSTIYFLNSGSTWFVNDNGTNHNMGSSDTDWHVLRVVGRGDLTSFWQMDGGEINIFSGSTTGPFSITGRLGANGSDQGANVSITNAYYRPTTELTPLDETYMWNYLGSPMERMLFDLGEDTAGYETSVPDEWGKFWNNVTANDTDKSASTIGLKVANAVDINNNSTTIGFAVDNPLAAGHSNNTGSNDSGVNSSIGDYPSTASRDSWFSWSGDVVGGISGGTWTFSGLTYENVYYFKFWGSRDTTGNRDILIQLGGGDWSTYETYNADNANRAYDNAAYFTVSGVTSQSFDLRSPNGSDLIGYVGVVDIRYHQLSGVGPEVSPSPTPSITITPSITPTITPSITVSPSITPSITPSVTPTITPSITVSPSITPSVTPTITPSITVSPSITPSVTPTITPSITVSPSITPSVTPTITPSITVSPSITPSITPSLTPTPSTTPPAGFDPFTDISWDVAFDPADASDIASVSGWTNQGSDPDDAEVFGSAALPLYVANSGDPYVHFVRDVPRQLTFPYNITVNSAYDIWTKFSVDDFDSTQALFSYGGSIMLRVLVTTGQLTVGGTSTGVYISTDTEYVVRITRNPGTGGTGTLTIDGGTPTNHDFVPNSASVGVFGGNDSGGIPSSHKQKELFAYHGGLLPTSGVTNMWEWFGFLVPDSVSLSDSGGVYSFDYDYTGSEVISNIPPEIDDVTFTGSELEGEVLTITCTWNKRSSLVNVGTSELIVNRANDLQDTSVTGITTLTNGSDVVDGDDVTTTYSYTIQESDVTKYMYFTFTAKITGGSNTDSLPHISDYTGVIGTDLITAMIQINSDIYSGGSNWNDVESSTITTGGTWINDIIEISNGDSTGFSLVGISGITYGQGGYWTPAPDEFFPPHNIPQNVVRTQRAMRNSDTPDFMNFKFTGLDPAKLYDIYIFSSCSSFSSYNQTIDVTVTGENIVTDQISEAYQNQLESGSCVSCEPTTGGELDVLMESPGAGGTLVSLNGIKIKERPV